MTTADQGTRPLWALRRSQSIPICRPSTGLLWVVASVLDTLHGLGCEYPPFLPLGAQSCPVLRPPDMISLLFYCLVLHTSYPSVVRISIVMLSVDPSLSQFAAPVRVCKLG